MVYQVLLHLEILFTLLPMALILFFIITCKSAAEQFISFLPVKVTQGIGVSAMTCSSIVACRAFVFSKYQIINIPVKLFLIKDFNRS